MRSNRIIFQVYDQKILHVTGLGLKGLLGIPERRGKILRPLLSFSREEIIQFAHKNKIQWREDSSNAKTDYLRNALRHEVIPQWKKRDPQIPKSKWWHTDAPFVGFRVVRPLKTPNEEEQKKYWKYESTQ